METCYSCGENLKVIKDQPYKYDESGLDVILLGIPQYVCDSCGEKYVALPNIQKLHRCIGRLICEKRKALLKSEEIKFLRKDLQLKAKELALTLGIAPQTLSRWENGKKPIGEAHDRLLRSIYMMCSSALEPQPDACLNIINIFKGFPHDRKKIDQPREISLNPQEWLSGNSGIGCFAT